MSRTIFPYSALIIDAEWSDCLSAIGQSLCSTGKRDLMVKQLQKLWTTKQNPNYVLPTLAVRTVLDIYLNLQNFPPGSEVIMSAINIPDMSFIVHQHNLKIVSLDINLHDLSPKVELFEALITPKTKLVIVAHIYGKWFDVNPLLDLCEKHNIPLLEDCAEGFHGLGYTGNPRSDLALFSFGGIKYSTSFGGAISKIRDKDLYTAIKNVHDDYPIQSQKEYLKKVVKYSFVRFLINTRSVCGTFLSLSRAVNFDIQKLIVKMVRGFPDNLMLRLRHQPCDALLATMLRRHSNHRPADTLQAFAKGEYMTQRLPEGAYAVGQNSQINNYWLFPVIVEYPEEVVRYLRELGVYAYRGATQLNLVEPDTVSQPSAMGYQPYDRADDKHLTQASSDSRESEEAKSQPKSNTQESQNTRSEEYNNPNSQDDQLGYTQDKKSGSDTSETKSDPLRTFYQTFPHEAKYLMDQVVYLPVTKLVSFIYLDHLAECVAIAVEKSLNGGAASNASPGMQYKPKLHSKL